jgi:succinate dehydrogenase / fumarate reductase, membrane anchor subunit
MASGKVITGAHYGLRDWLAQRITALLLASYSIYLVVRSFMVSGPLDYFSWSQIFSSNFMKVFTLVTLLALLYHVWVGVRDIYMDYIKPTSIRLGLQVATIIALIGYACWAIITLWRV